MNKLKDFFQVYRWKIALLLLTFSTHSLYAVDGEGVVSNFAINNPLGTTKTIPDLLVLIINQFVLPIGGVIVTFMFIYTGFLFVMAQGNEQKVTDAKKTLIHTVIGAAIVLGALSISVIIKATVDQITNAI